MSIFEKALEYVLENEGGHSNDPKDPGGETNFGLSKRFLDSHKNDPLCLIKPLDMTPEIAKIIYKKYFWQPSQLETLKDVILTIKVFDSCVNSGIGTSIRLLQKSYNKLYPPSYVIADGILGQKSQIAINAINSPELLDEFINAMIYRYKELVVKNKNNERFINGWIARARRMPKEN